MKHLETGRWYHVACTDQNTRTARIYVDGQIQSEVTGIVGITTQNDKNCINLPCGRSYDLWTHRSRGRQAPSTEELGGTMA